MVVILTMSPIPWWWKGNCKVPRHHRAMPDHQGFGTRAWPAIVSCLVLIPVGWVWFGWWGVAPHEGKRWVVYDRQYCWEALARKDLNWSVPDPQLYNEAFTGRARAIPKCRGTTILSCRAREIPIRSQGGSSLTLPSWSLPPPFGRPPPGGMQVV